MLLYCSFFLVVTLPPNLLENDTEPPIPLGVVGDIGVSIVTSVGRLRGFLSPVSIVDSVKVPPLAKMFCPFGSLANATICRKRVRTLNMPNHTYVPVSSNEYKGDNTSLRLLHTHLMSLKNYT